MITSREREEIIRESVRRARIRQTSGTGGGSTPLASSTVSGTVKTDTNTADPVVYLDSSVDTLLGAKADVGELVESAGPTVLTMGAVANGEYLKRSGTTIIGDTPAGGASAVDDDPLASYEGGLTASAYDDDFNGTALDAKWTKNPLVTANALSLTVSRGRLIIAPSNYAATARFYGIGQVETGGGSFKIWSKLSSVGGGTDTYNGIFVADSAGKAHITGVAVNGTALMLSNMGATAYGEGGSDWSGYDGYNNTNAGPWASTGASFLANWYRIRWNASTSTIYFDYSLDGDKWINWHSRSGMSQPNRIGLGMYAQSNPAGWAAGIDLRVRCFRYEANATL